MHSPVHVILADDERQLRELLAAFLEQAGFVVHHAADGSEALALYAQHPGSVVVIDMIMPGMEGIETILAFTRLHPEARLIAISGGGRMAEGPLLKAAAHIGARSTLAQPFDPSDLLRVIQELLEADLPPRSTP